MFNVRCPRCSEKVGLLLNYNKGCAHCGAHLKPASWRPMAISVVVLAAIFIPLFRLLQPYPFGSLLYFVVMYVLGAAILCRTMKWRIATDVEVSRLPDSRTVIITFVVAFAAGLIAAVAVFLYLSYTS